MAVKDKSDCNKEASEAASIEWNVENELQLLLVLCGTKPIGKHVFLLLLVQCEKHLHLNST